VRSLLILAAFTAAELPSAPDSAPDERVIESKANGEKEDAQVEKQRAALALKLAKKGAREYRLCLTDERRTELKLQSEPLLRWSNPAVGSIHGGVFLWTHQGRPAAIASVYKWFSPNTHMAFEVHSLSTQPILALRDSNVVWNPSRAGVEFKLLAEAPAPAESAVARLAQMRAIAREFVVAKTDRDDKSEQQMRLLAQPVFRYESREAGVADGALFVFVQGTDPEVLLLVEAHATDQASDWHFALARMDSTQFSVTRKNRVVWTAEELPWNDVLGGDLPYRVLNLDRLNREPE